LKVSKPRNKKKYVKRVKNVYVIYEIPSSDTTCHCGNFRRQREGAECMLKEIMVKYSPNPRREKDRFVNLTGLHID
jgi:hypothetical protein